MKGFTFLGMLIIVLLTSVFGSLLYITLTPTEGTADAEETIKKMEKLKTALTRYKTDNVGGNYPANLDQLVNSVAPACYMDQNSGSSTYRRLRGWCGPYFPRTISALPNDFKTDAWGTVIQYNGTQITSCGPNRTCGNSDDISFSLP